MRQGSGDRAEEMENLIKWEGMPEFESTWESSTEQLFPAFHLEDKVVLWAGVMQEPSPSLMLGGPSPRSKESRPK